MSPKPLVRSQNNVAISAATIWEIRIKQQLKKVQVPQNFREVIESQPFEDLPVTSHHCHAVAALPMHHRDPFDRILIAQSQIERLILVTHDGRIKEYDVETLLI